ncbi:MAG: AAA family ATPase [Candidatus Woesearchaeota archaeon]
MGLFDDALRDNESLFKDDIALNADFTPPKVSYRENENDRIAECIKPLFQKRSGKNLFITGGPGIGKTLATRKVLEELEQKTDDIIPLYVNCWKKDSAHKIISGICAQIGYRFTVNKTTEQLMNEVANVLNKRSCVIVLDEVDKLPSEAMSILYSFSEDIFRKTIIFITNDKGFLSFLDRRIYSRLMPEILEFRVYNRDETYGILRQRMEYAFVKGVFCEDCLRKVAEKTFELKDLRVGLHLLREAGNVAERKLKRKVEVMDVEEAIGKLAEFKSGDVKKLNDKENSLLDIIKENSGKSSKELHEIFDSSISYRTFSRRLKDLEEAKLIHIEEENVGAVKRSLVHFGSLKKLSDF